mmetsp:Transcript_11453/g.17247  ORF Transcript_11453/g.17247 Transcript_11453/m.17247 type:complete len:187 (+) Transcript_11453:1027-1587(+)
MSQSQNVTESAFDLKSIRDQKVKEGRALANKLDKLFSSIKISSFNLILDPFLGCLLWPFEMCCKRRGCFLRPKILEKCEEKFTDELEVTNLLSKVRLTYDMLAHLLTKEQKLLLKYNKERVIDLDSLTESSSSSGESSSSSEEEKEYDGSGTDPEFEARIEDGKPVRHSRRNKVEKFLPKEFQNAF